MEAGHRITVRSATTAMKQQSLRTAMIICFVLSVFNVRGGMLTFTENKDFAYDLPWISSFESNRLDTSNQLSVLVANKKNAAFASPSQEQHQLKNETIIVGLANNAYVEVAILWYRRMTEVGFNTHRILAADMKTAWICEELELRYDDLATFTKAVVPSCPSYKENANGWDKKTYLFAARWIYVRQKLKEGYHVLLTDVDAVYNYNVPLSKFETEPFDHITAYADKMPANVFRQTGFTICGCFNWLRSTPGMIEFLDMLLSNCGCIAEQNVKGKCKCGCDDQVTMNSMFFYQMDMNWDPYKGSTNGEFLQNSMTGASQRTGQRIKVLDRNFVHRGHKNNTCTTGNWLTFPKTSNATEPKLDQMQRLLGNCPLRKGLSLSKAEGPE
jgi:hypothetical protein